MTQTELEQLSRQVAAKRGCEPFKATYHMSGGEYFEDTLWLTDDSAFCFELMVSEIIDVGMFRNGARASYGNNGIYVSNDDDTDANQATRVTILRAYLAKGE